MKDKMGILVFSDWQTLFQNLNDEQAGQLIKAMCFYNKGEEYTPSDPVVVAMFAMIKEGMDNNKVHYDKVCQRRAEAGKKGAAKRWEDSKSHTENGNCYSGDSKTSQKWQNQSESVTESESVTVTENVKPPTEAESHKGAKRAVFVPPTVEEVEAYCFERNNRVNAEEFVDFYSSKGWMIGKNKMKDWRAAVRTWERSKRDNVVELTAAQRQAQERHEVLQRIMRGEQ